MKIAIIGSGITGLGAAWLLSPHHDITVYEQDDRVGGHANTIMLDGHPALDTGFMVFNKHTYPNFVALLKHLNVAFQDSDMSFSVSLERRNYEYGSDGKAGFFAQKENYWNPNHYLLLWGMQKFFKNAARYLDDPRNESLRDYLARNHYPRAFVRDHLVPMAAAIWSADAKHILDFPARTFIQFYKNHGLLIPDITKRPVWQTISGGSKHYVESIKVGFAHKIRTNEQVRRVDRDVSGISVTTLYNHTDHYDHVIFACHADQALKLLPDADELERKTLGAFHYSDNLAVLHRDDHFMPRTRAAWSSWNYYQHDKNGVGVTYWLNRLHNLKTRANYFVTLNPAVEPFGTMQTIHYRHPQFDLRTYGAQKKINLLQGRNGCWFAGAWCGYGFHEDGLTAGLTVAELLSGQKRPWAVKEISNAVAHILGTSI